MAQPPINGILASSAGAAAMSRSGWTLPELVTDRISMPSDLGIGLLVAFAVLIYWYRRVL
jgi:hypothetical protein